jgi:hypothetical protein
MNAAGVIANHPAQRATVMRRRIGRERQPMFFRRGPQMIEHNSRLHPRNTARRINLQDRRHVFGKIEDYRDIAALTGQRSSAAAAQDGSAIFAGQSNRGDYIVGIAGNNHPNGDLPVIGSVGGVERAAARIEADFAAQVATQGSGKFFRVHNHRLGNAGKLCEVLRHVDA